MYRSSLKTHVSLSSRIAYLFSILTHFLPQKRNCLPNYRNLLVLFLFSLKQQELRIKNSKIVILSKVGHSHPYLAFNGNSLTATQTLTGSSPFSKNFA
jgi:hypothetical protein